jgi:transcriptional regulator with XRE-family HTH domain
MNRLKELRKSKNLTLKELSNELSNIGLNLSDSQLSFYENGVRSPRGKEGGKATWKEIADYFNVSMAYLMGLSEFRTFEEEHKAISKNFGVDSLPYDTITNNETGEIVNIIDFSEVRLRDTKLIFEDVKTGAECAKIILERASVPENREQYNAAYDYLMAGSFSKSLQGANEILDDNSRLLMLRFIENLLENQILTLEKNK